MTVEILTGSGGILSYLQDILGGGGGGGGGFCPRQQKRVGGGDFVLHSSTPNDTSSRPCLISTITHDGIFC